MTAANATDPPTFTLDDLCRFLEANRGSLTVTKVAVEGFIGCKATIKVQPPGRDVVVHELHRPDAKSSPRPTPPFANEIEQMVRHLKLAYPMLEPP
jgi:hypothetical protein